MTDDPTAAVEHNVDAFFVEFGRVPGGAVHDEGDLVRFRSGAPIPIWNGVATARLDPTVAEDRIRHALACFASDAVPMTWHLGPGSRPTDLEARLERHGLVRGAASVGMTMSIPAATLPAAPPELTVRVVATDADLKSWIDVLSASFEIPAPVTGADLFRRGCAHQALRPGSPFRYYVACWEGEPVASAQLFLDGESAGIYGVGTIPGHRRRGIGAAVTAALLRDAAALGHERAVLASTQMALGVYTELGFVRCCELVGYVWSPS